MATQINGHEYVDLSTLARMAGFKSAYSIIDARRHGVPVTTISTGPGKRPHYLIERGEAQKFAEHVLAQRADGRQLNFGYNAPAPGESAAAQKVRAARVPYVDPRIDVEGTREEMRSAPPNALAVAQLAQIQSTLARIEGHLGVINGRLDAINQRTSRNEIVLDAICRELNIKV